MRFTEKTAIKMSYTKFQHARRIVKWFVWRVEKFRRNKN